MRSVPLAAGPVISTRNPESATRSRISLASVRHKTSSKQPASWARRRVWMMMGVPNKGCKSLLGYRSEAKRAGTTQLTLRVTASPANHLGNAEMVHVHGRGVAEGQFLVQAGHVHVFAQGAG